MARRDESARRHFAALAETVERAGDSVGSNDPVLSNALYRAARGLRDYAEHFAETTPAPRVKIGDEVRVVFDNAIVTAVDEDTGQVRVGSARFYGGGMFDVDQVSVRR